MGQPLHETEKNFIRPGVIALNHLNALGLDNTAVAAVSPSTIAGLETKINALNVHEVEKNFLRQYGGGTKSMLQKLSDLKTPIGKPGAPTLTKANSGGSIADADTVYVVVTAIDIDGVESIAGVEASIAVTDAGGDDHTVTVKNLVAINGAASYRIYFGNVGTGAYEKGYKADASKAVEGGTGVTVTTLASGLTAGTPPATSVAKVGALSDTEIAAAVTTGTFAALLGKVTADDSTVLSTLDRGGQF